MSSTLFEALRDPRRAAGAWLRHRLAERQEYDHLGRLLPRLGVDCVFDVGANEGQYARMLRRKAGFRGLILSYEPNPAAARVLRRAARGDPLWHVEEIALAESEEAREFNVMADAQFSSLSAPRHDETALFREANRVIETVRLTTGTLASAFARLKAAHGFRRPFLKMDTQGSDLAVFRGGAPIIAAFVGLQSELSVRPLYADAVDFREALSEYEAAGFRLSAFVPNNAGHFPELVEIDCIMMRPEALEPA